MELDSDTYNKSHRDDNIQATDILTQFRICEF